MDQEYHMPAEPAVPDIELAPLGDEYNATASDPPRRKGRFRAALAKLMVVLLAVSMVQSDSSGFSLLGGFFSGAFVSSTSQQSSGSTDAADDAFPVLTNLEPNGTIPGYGVINEQYIRLESASGSVPAQKILLGSAYGDAGLDTVPGVRYDAGTNTLTLDNYSGEVLNVNIMGNGFTIRLVGENRLDHLLVWGFMYGGSVTFTGTGSLTVNENNAFAQGILLRAEESESCIMVDSGVTLRAYGTEAAIMVQGTSMRKAIYYLRPLELKGGIRSGGDFMPDFDGAYASAHGDYRDYTIVYEAGEPAKSVAFE